MQHGRTALNDLIERLMQDKNQNIARSLLRLVATCMQRDLSFRFTDTRSVIAYTCDQYVEMELESE